MITMIMNTCVEDVDMSYLLIALLLWYLQKDVF